MATIGTPPARLDGAAKVTGEARYGSDVSWSNAAYAVLVTSSIAKGQIRAIDEREARSVVGTIEILTHRNIGKIEPGNTFDEGGYMGTTIAPLASAKIFHDGQIIAIVV